LIVVAFLFPLAVYCLLLGFINRRRHPLMVSGAWDFAGLVFAASGFLAFGLPGLLNGFSEHGRRLALFGRPAGADEGSWAWFWELFDGLCMTFFSVGNSAVLLCYFALVVSGCAWILWRRQSQTSIYNIHPEVFDEVFAAVLAAAGLSWSRAGNRYFIGRGDKARETDENDPAPAAPSPVLVQKQLPAVERRGRYPATAEDIERSTYLEVDPSVTLCHVTLRWDIDEDDLRPEIEAELRRALAEVRTRHNPIAGWQLTFGGVLLTTVAVIFAIVVLFKLFLER
jgi:hypothetical protein